MVELNAVDGNTELMNGVVLKLADFEDGSTPPTAGTVPTSSSPAVPSLRFDAVAESVIFNVKLPCCLDKANNLTLVLCFALAVNESNSDTLDVTLDYVCPRPGETGEGVLKTSTAVVGQVTVTTADGLAAGDVYEMSITIAFDDSDNPIADANMLCGEFHLTNVTGVGDVHLLGGSLKIYRTA